MVTLALQAKSFALISRSVHQVVKTAVHYSINNDKITSSYSIEKCYKF
jgi:hypothetical protein